MLGKNTTLDKFLTYFAKSLSSEKADEASRETTFLDLNQTNRDGGMSRGCGNNQELERKRPLSIVKHLATEEKYGDNRIWYKLRLEKHFKT